MPLTIRRARPEEAADLSTLIFLSKQSNGYDDAFMAACADALRVTPEDVRHGQIWVAKTTQSLLGCVTLTPGPTKTEGEISSFFIHPDSKRQGVGKMLWQTVLSAARGQGMRRLRLDADPAAVSFYEAMGFTVIGETPSEAIPGRVLPVMEMDISTAP